MSAPQAILFLLSHFLLTELATSSPTPQLPADLSRTGHPSRIAMSSSTSQAIAAPTAIPAANASVDIENQASPASVVGQYRKSSTIPGRDVPLMTFGNPAHEGTTQPFFVAVDFGDTRGIVHGTFDYLPNDISECQFLSMDQLQLSQRISCPEYDAQTVRATLSMTAPTWTMAVAGRAGAWITGTFPSTWTATATRTSSSTYPLYATWTNYRTDPTPHISAWQYFRVEWVLLTIALVCFCTVGVMVMRQMKQDATLAAASKAGVAETDASVAGEKEPLPVYSG